MIFFLLSHAFSLLLDLIWVRRRAEQDKDIGILLLRQQLRILQRKQPRAPRISRWGKLALVVLADKITGLTTSARGCLGHVVLLFKPETLLKWHRELVRRKWTFKKKARLGRPAASPELEAVILQLAKENPSWGYGKLEGELRKLGSDIGRSTIRDVLKRRRVPPAPDRGKHGSRWRRFLANYKGEIVACDFFTVETAWLKTLDVLFFIELGSRRVHLAGCTATPMTAWMTQQARHVRWKIQDGDVAIRFLIHDRDTKFAAAFDTGFTSEDVKIIRTPVRAPNANAFAERWLRPVRRGMPGQTPHSERATPPPCADHLLRDGPIQQRDILGGILHDYYRRAA